MPEVKQFGGVNWNAPLFKIASISQLEQIVEHLSSASYHYADDSGREWEAGRKSLVAAAEECAKLHLSIRALRCLYRHTSQLIGEDQFIDEIMYQWYLLGVAKGRTEAAEAERTVLKAEVERLRRIILKNWRSRYWQGATHEDADEVNTALKETDHD